MRMTTMRATRAHWDGRYLHRQTHGAVDRHGALGRPSGATTLRPGARLSETLTYPPSYHGSAGRTPHSRAAAQASGALAFVELHLR